MLVSSPVIALMLTLGLGACDPDGAAQPEPKADAEPKPQANAENTAAPKSPEATASDKEAEAGVALPKVWAAMKLPLGEGKVNDHSNDELLSLTYPSGDARPIRASLLSALVDAGWKQTTTDDQARKGIESAIEAMRQMPDVSKDDLRRMEKSLEAPPLELANGRKTITLLITVFDDRLDAQLAIL